jgi:hypothetical protein
MTSIYLIIFTLGSGLEIGYVTGKTHRLCDRMGHWLRKWRNSGASQSMHTAATQASPVQRPVARQ